MAKALEDPREHTLEDAEIVESFEFLVADEEMHVVATIKDHATNPQIPTDSKLSNLTTVADEEMNTDQPLVAAVSPAQARGTSTFVAYQVSEAIAIKTVDDANNKELQSISNKVLKHIAVDCSVVSFGEFLFDKDAPPFAAKDEHEVQVQFALKCGTPAFSAVKGSLRPPFNGNVTNDDQQHQLLQPWPPPLLARDMFDKMPDYSVTDIWDGARWQRVMSVSKEYHCSIRKGFRINTILLPLVLSKHRGPPLPPWPPPLDLTCKCNLSEEMLLSLVLLVNCYSEGKCYSLIVPDEIEDGSYHSLFKSIMDKVIEASCSCAVLLHCEVDSLFGDQLGSFKLSIRGHAVCLKYMWSFNASLFLLGGDKVDGSDMVDDNGFINGENLAQGNEMIQSYEELKHDIEIALQLTIAIRIERISDTIAVLQKVRGLLLIALCHVEVDYVSMDLEFQNLFESRTATEEEDVSLLEQFTKDATDPADSEREQGIILHNAGIFQTSLFELFPSLPMSGTSVIFDLIIEIHASCVLVLKQLCETKQRLQAYWVTWEVYQVFINTFHLSGVTTMIYHSDGSLHWWIISARVGEVVVWMFSLGSSGLSSHIVCILCQLGHYSARYDRFPLKHRWPEDTAWHSRDWYLSSDSADSIIQAAICSQIVELLFR